MFLKKIKITSLFLLCIIHQTSSNAQTFESFIDAMETTPKHTSVLEFAYENYIYPTTNSGNGTGIALNFFPLGGLNGRPMKFHHEGKIFNGTFHNSKEIILSKYDINPNIKTILLRTDYGYPESLSLLNFKKESGKYIPVADLSAARGGGGEHVNFYFNTEHNWVISTYADESTYALGIAYEIDDTGNFIEVHRQEFNEATYQGVFEYNGSNVPPLPHDCIVWL